MAKHGKNKTRKPSRFHDCGILSSFGEKKKEERAPRFKTQNMEKITVTKGKRVEGKPFFDQNI